MKKASVYLIQKQEGIEISLSDKASFPDKLAGDIVCDSHYQAFALAGTLSYRYKQNDKMIVPYCFDVTLQEVFDDAHQMMQTDEHIEFLESARRSQMSRFQKFSEWILDILL